MGKALLTANLGQGLYEIEIDYGSAEKDKGISDATFKLQKIAQKLAELAPKISKADEEERDIRLQMGVALALYETELAKMKPNDKPPEPKAYKELYKKLGDLQAKNQPLRQLKKAEETNRTYWQKQLTYWQAFEPIERRKAWCVDYTDLVQPGRVVKTIEIPGEPATIVIGPRCRSWSAADGELKAREVQKPHQVFFNAAILPGWQIDKPTYRSGVIKKIKRKTGVCEVELDSIGSSAQGLGINRLQKLIDTPFDYMTSGHESFIEGDHVVIEFRGNDWGSPFVIGFVKEPVIEWRWNDAYAFVSIVQNQVNDWPVDGRPGRMWFYQDSWEAPGPNFPNGERFGWRGYGPVSKVITYELLIEGSYDSVPEQYGKSFFRNIGKQVLCKTTYGDEFVGDWPVTNYLSTGITPQRYVLPAGQSPATKTVSFEFSLNLGAPTISVLVNSYSFSDLTSMVLPGGETVTVAATHPFFDNQKTTYYINGSWITDKLHSDSLALTTAVREEKTKYEIWSLFGAPEYVVIFRGRSRPYEVVSELLLGGIMYGYLPGEKDRLRYVHRVVPYTEFE